MDKMFMRQHFGNLFCSFYLYSVLAYIAINENWMSEAASLLLAQSWAWGSQVIEKYFVFQ